MVTLAAIDEQLKQASCPIRGWGRSEVRELCEILLPGETIYAAVNGQYDAGFGLLVTTDFRVLLVDQKPKYLTLKDIRFDMITELDFAARLMDSTIRIYTPNREIRFTSFNATRLRKLFKHTQHKVMELRNHFVMTQLQQQEFSKNTPPGVLMAMQGEDRRQSAIDVSPVSAVTSIETSASPAILPSSSQPQPVLQGYLDSTEEQVKLAAAMGKAGLKSIVHNGRVIKDYMAVPFTQRWRKRPYGYMNTPITGQ